MERGQSPNQQIGSVRSAPSADGEGWSRLTEKSGVRGRPGFSPEDCLAMD